MALCLALAAGTGCGLLSIGGEGSCTSTDDCPDGYTCQGGTCVPAADAGGGAGDAGGRDAARADAGAADRVQPADAAAPDAATADVHAADVPTADAPTTDAATTDVRMTDAAATDAATTDAPMTDASLPDVGTTDGAMTDGQLTDAAALDAQPPDTSPPDTSTPDTSTPDTAFPITPLLWAVHPPIATAGATIYLEGSFPAGASAQVLFERRSTPPFTISAPVRRLAVQVPDGAGSGPLRVVVDGYYSNEVAFRYATFQPRLGTFSRHYEQTVAAREMPTLGSWRRRFSAVLRRPWLYLIGGSIDNQSSTYIQRARVYADGTLGPFEDHTTELNTRRQGPAVAVAGNLLFVVGGEDDSAGDDGQLTSYEMSSFSSQGELGPFVQHEDALNTPRMDAQAVVLGSYLYVIAGRECDDHSTCPTRSVERAPI